MEESFTMTERVCLNADKSAVVDCNSEAAAFQLGGPGTQIPYAEAEKYGLVRAAKPAKAEDKADLPTEDKATTTVKAKKSRKKAK